MRSVVSVVEVSQLEGGSLAGHCLGGEGGTGAGHVGGGYFCVEGGKACLSLLFRLVLNFPLTFPLSPSFHEHCPI